MDPSRPGGVTNIRIAWADGHFRLILGGEAAGIRLSIFEGSVLVFQETVASVAAAARLGHEVIGAIRRGERPGCERGSA
jgi:hypothetical protein